MSENASIVQTTSFMAGNGVVLLKVFDVVNHQPEPMPVGQFLFLLAFLILPPILGLASAWLVLLRIELHQYKPTKRPDQRLLAVGALGIAIPITIWVYHFVTVETGH